MVDAADQAFDGMTLDQLGVWVFGDVWRSAERSTAMAPEHWRAAGDAMRFGASAELVAELEEHVCAARQLHTIGVCCAPADVSDADRFELHDRGIRPGAMFATTPAPTFERRRPVQISLEWACVSTPKRRGRSWGFDDIPVEDLARRLL